MRVDPDLLAELEDLARQRLVPAGFSDQVEAGLRLLVRHAAEEQPRHAAGLVGADRPRAERTYRAAPGSRRPVSAGQVWRRLDGLRWVKVPLRSSRPGGV